MNLPQPPAVTTVAVEGGASFPVRRIYCVGRNYRAHAIEMGADPDREPPFFFMKPTDAIVASGSRVRYPPRTADYQHEVELVVAIGRGGRDIAAAQALEHVFGYAVGLDMTRRDLQMQARKAGRPWDLGKGFDQSAPCGMLRPVQPHGHIERGRICVEVNGQPRQVSDVSQMIWNVPEIIADLSTYGALEPGDLIFTGTPEGVAAVRAGDRLRARIEGLRDLDVAVVE